MALEPAFLAVFLVGLLGGVHCVGMCGGIVSALSLQPVVKINVADLKHPSASPWVLQLAYNTGRISSYVVAGALLGSLGQVGLLLNHVLPIQMGLYVAANLMLVALGIYLTGFTRSLAITERLGRLLWQRLQPLTRRYLPARSIKQAYPLGLLWGWLPCGMVYSILTLALLSGSAGRGAATMLAFGLGTLPSLMLAGLLLQRFRHVMQAPYVRLLSGLVVLGFGVWGLMNALSLGGRLWQGIVCHLP